MYLFSALHGHGTSSAPSASGMPDRVHARHELAFGAERVQRAPAHARHDAHAHGDVRRVGQLHADVALVRAERTHREGHHVHRAPAHRACEQLVERLAHLRRVAPVVRRAGLLLGRRADERAVLDARDVPGIRQRQIGVRPLGVGELLEGARLDERLAEPVVLLGRAVAPVDVVRFGERGDLSYPGKQALVGRGGGSGRVHRLKQLLDRGHDRRADTILDRSARSRPSGPGKYKNARRAWSTRLPYAYPLQPPPTRPRRGLLDVALASPAVPGFLRGTSTSRLNSATSTPS